jgi:hypothetical protein
MRTSVSEIGNALLGEYMARLAEQLGRDVELLRDGELLGVVVCALELPAGIYSKPATDMLLQTTVQYPLSAMDTFWVDEDLTLAGGHVPVGGESRETHFGRRWRRYSWHRNAPWQPGRDDLVGHFEFSIARLQRPQ